MSWLSDLVGPRLKEIVGSEREHMDARSCEKCRSELSTEIFQTNIGVCPKCGQANPLRPEERFSALFDDAQFVPVDTQPVAVDVLRFRDVRRYADRVKEAQQRTAHSDALVVARGKAGGNDLVAACIDHAFLDGTIGIEAGVALARAVRLAALQRVPLVLFSAPGLARSQEGVTAFAHAGRIFSAFRELRKVGMPTVVVLVADHRPSGMHPFFGFCDIVVREVQGAARDPEDVGRDPGNETTEQHETEVDSCASRLDLKSVLVELVDIATNRRASAPVLPLHPSEIDSDVSNAWSKSEDADPADHVSEH